MSSPSHEDVSEAALTFDQLLPEEQFFQQGLGEGDAMIFDDGKFKDQALLRKVLLSGQRELKLSRVADLYHHVDSTDAKRSMLRVRVRSAFAAFPCPVAGEGSPLP